MPHIYFNLFGHQFFYCRKNFLPQKISSFIHNTATVHMTQISSFMEIWFHALLSVSVCKLSQCSGRTCVFPDVLPSRIYIKSSSNPLCIFHGSSQPILHCMRLPRVLCSRRPLMRVAHICIRHGILFVSLNERIWISTFILDILYFFI